MRYIRGGTANPARVVPLPGGWKFIEEAHHLQISVGRKQWPRYKLIYDL